jgi:hypothetical protein
MRIEIKDGKIKGDVGDGWYAIRKINKIVIKPGDKFGSREALEYSDPRKGTNQKVMCRCECGFESKVSLVGLLYGKSVHCSKCAREYTRGENHPNWKGGKERTEDKLYKTFNSIKDRCNNPNATGYKYWGGRGIKCLWDSYEEFERDMRDSFEKHNKKYGGRYTTIDRINNNGHYCKENTRWCTPKIQGENRRCPDLRRFLINGESLTTTEIKKKYKIRMLNRCLEPLLIKGLTVAEIKRDFSLG